MHAGSKPEVHNHQIALLWFGATANLDIFVLDSTW